MKRGKPLKIVVDTNIWISVLIGKSFSHLREVFTNLQPVVLYDDILVAEIKKTVQKSSLRKYFKEADQILILDFLFLFGKKVIVGMEVRVFRDPKDNYLLSLSAEGNADFLITGDQDLLMLKTFGSTSIVSVNEFLSVIESNNA